MSLAKTALVKSSGVREAVYTAVTGRVPLYHGTSKGRAQRIRSEGLRPDVEGGISGKLGPGEANRGLVFTSRKKDVSGLYAKQQSGMDDVRSKRGRGRPSGGAEVLRLNVPAHRLDKVRNPEHAIEARKVERRKQRAKGKGAKKNWELLKDTAQQTRVFSGDVVHSGSVPSKYIRGSKDYKGVSPKEVVRHVARSVKNPRGLAKSVIKSLTGVEGYPRA